MAQFGRALRSGRRGRKFESCRLDLQNVKACWSSGQDDALSRRKPGFDSRTGHEAVWNFHTASFFVLHFIYSTILSLHCPCFVPEPPCLLSNFVRRFLAYKVFNMLLIERNSQDPKAATMYSDCR